MSLAYKSGTIRDVNFYIGRMEDSEEYKATIKTHEGPEEKTYHSFDAAISWVNTIIENEENNEIE